MEEQGNAMTRVYVIVGDEGLWEETHQWVETVCERLKDAKEHLAARGCVPGRDFGEREEDGKYRGGPWYPAHDCDWANPLMFWVEEHEVRQGSRRRENV